MRNQSSSTGLLERLDAASQTLLADETTVPALTYTQVRLLCECALGINDTPAHFVFAGQALMRTESNTVPETAVLVPSLQKGRFPSLVQVGLQSAPAEQGEGVTVNAVDCFADAVFWSDSAVQKFLFPYLTSCAGSQAAEVLGRLQQAWNHYPADAVTVYALIHVTPQDFTAPLELGNAFWVMYAAADGTLGAQPLDAFFRETSLEDGVNPTTTGTTQPIRVEYRRGSMASTAPQYPDYVTLRGMAEYAASLASDPYYFVFRAGQQGFDEPVSSQLPADLGPGDFVVPAWTPTVPRQRPELGAVWFQPAGQPASDIGHTGDALFWSTGAIEQFMFPYYASKLGFAAPEDLVSLRSAWDPDYGLAAPEERSGEKESAAAAAPGNASLDGDTEVYALVHLPRSDWVTGDSAEAGARAESWAKLSPHEQDMVRRAREKSHVGRFSLLHEVGVLHRARSGAVNVLTLADFKALYPHRFK